MTVATAKYIHVFKTPDGRLSDQVGTAETLEEAVEWLFDHLDDCWWGSDHYHCTLKVYDELPLNPERINLMRQLEELREEDRQMALDDRRHELSLLGPR